MNELSTAKRATPVKSQPHPLKQTRPEAPPSYRHLAARPIWIGVITAILFFGVFGGWAAMAPLVGGATASGVVSPDLSRRVIQHLEGGIVRKVHVHEGQFVHKGDPLITLDSIKANANYSARRDQWLRLLITAARIEAQANDLHHVTLPPELDQYPSAELKEFADTQIELFKTRRTSLTQQEQILERQIDQSNNQIASITAQNKGLGTQVALIDEEITDKAKLLNQKLVNKSDVLELRRQQASLKSSVSANKAKIAQTEQQIEEIRLKLLQAREQFRDKVAQEATDVNDKIASIEKEMVSTGDVLNRTELRSPVDGTVLNLKTPAPGGVIQPGEQIMDIVPRDDRLIVVARLNPRFIDLVHKGLTAHVELLPFQNRNTLPLIGTVTQVGADVLTDSATHQAYYEVRVQVPADEVARHPTMYLSAGMPAQVVIVTNKRTMLQYLFEPVIRTLRTAFVYD